MDDIELVGASLCGEARGFRTLVLRHRVAAFHKALSITHSTWDSEEIAASAFLELWQKRESIFFVDRSAYPWLMNVVHNISLNRIRGGKRYQSLLARVPYTEVQGDHADLVANFVDFERENENIREAIGRLSAADARVIDICVGEGLSMQDAAMRLGVPVGTVKSRLSRAKQRLGVELRVIIGDSRLRTLLCCPPFADDVTSLLDTGSVG